MDVIDVLELERRFKDFRVDFCWEKDSACFVMLWGCWCFALLHLDFCTCHSTAR